MNMDRHYRIDERTALKIKDRSKELKISESEYVRRLILSDLYPLDQTRMKEILRQTTVMGNSVNQIASRAKQQGLSEEDIQLIDSFRTELILMRDSVQLLKRKIEGGDA